jgi:hypothetical protein
MNVTERKMARRDEMPEVPRVGFHPIVAGGPVSHGNFMKAKFVFAIFLLSVGATALIYQGFPWVRPLSTATAAEKPSALRPSLAIAGIALGCGSLLLLSARRNAVSTPSNPQSRKKQI